MKTMHVAVLHQADTDLQLLFDDATNHPEYSFKFYTDDEAIIEASGAQQYDLLIIDKTIEQHQINKVEKIIDMLHPNAANTVMEFNDAAYIAYKLTLLYTAWLAANDDNRRTFHDNYNLQ